MTGPLVALAALAGLLFGSFANVLIHRLPRGQSVVSPPSRCPACGHRLAWYDNVPLLSWLLWLRGRCRSCKAPIPWRYPAVELCIAAGWAALAAWLPPGSEMITGMALFYLLFVLSMIDIETGLLPDALTFPGIAIGLALAFWQGHLVDSAIGVVAGYGFFWLVAAAFHRLTGREGMGYGDFKLLAMLGAFMGWQALPFIVFVSSLTGAVVGGGLLLLSRRGLRAEIPFGPYLAAAGMIWFLAGPALLQWYFGLLHPLPA